jgi:N-acetyltransferase 10
LALFVKVVRKISKRLGDIQKDAITATMPELVDPSSAASRLGTVADFVDAQAIGDLEDELNVAGDEATRLLREKQRAMIDSLDLKKWVIFYIWWWDVWGD